MVSGVILILAIVLTVAAGGLFAGAETGIYQLSQLRLRLGIEKKQFSFIILGKSLRDGAALLISILVGNNLAHYITTSIVTYILLSRFQSEHTAEILAAVITAPVLFVFSEMIPKSLFFYRADYLMPYTGPVLFIFHKLFTWCGLVPLLKILSQKFALMTGTVMPKEAVISAVQKPHIRAILKEMREEEFLSPVQADIIDRLASISNVGIKAVMIPIGKVQMVEVNSDRSVLLGELKKSAFTRLLVYEDSLTNIIGFVNIYECLSLPGEFNDLRQFVKPIRKLAADIVVTDAINIMQEEKQKIILVTKASHIDRPGPVGIVTMKDLVEELIGELAEW